MTPDAIAAGCAGKDPLTRRQADDIVRRANSKGNKFRATAYKCQHCDSWHVGRGFRTARLKAFKGQRG